MYVTSFHLPFSKKIHLNWFDSKSIPLHYWEYFKKDALKPFHAVVTVLNLEDRKVELFIRLIEQLMHKYLLMWEIYIPIKITLLWLVLEVEGIL